MALTTRSDLIVKDILVQAIAAAFPGMRVLLGSRAVIVNGSLPTNTIDGGRIQGGTRITVPYFNVMGNLEWLNEGDALTPTKLTMSDEQASVEHGGKAVEITTWAQFAAMYADPYAEFARQFVEIVQNGMEDRILQVASAGLPSSNVLDVWSNSTSRLFDWDLMVDAKMLWGDEQDNIELITMHSAVFGDLLKLKDSTGRPLAVDVGEGGLGRFCGIPVKVSDRNTVIDPGGGQRKKYKTKIVKRGALAIWYNGQPQMKTDSDILTDSDLAAIHVYVAFHRYLRAPGGSKSGVIEIIHNSSKN